MSSSTKTIDDYIAAIYLEDCLRIEPNLDETNAVIYFKDEVKKGNSSPTLKIYPNSIATAQFRGVDEGRYLDCHAIYAEPVTKEEQDIYLKLSTLSDELFGTCHIIKNNEVYMLVDKSSNGKINYGFFHINLDDKLVFIPKAELLKPYKAPSGNWYVFRNDTLRFCGPYDNPNCIFDNDLGDEDLGVIHCLRDCIEADYKPSQTP